MTLYEIKSEARENLKKKRLFSAASFLVVAIIFLLFVWLLFYICPIYSIQDVTNLDGTTQNYDLSWGIISFPIWAFLIYPVVRLSFANIYLKIAKGEKPEISDCYSGFKNYWKAVLLSFVKTLLVLVWIVLAYLVSYLNTIFINLTTSMPQTQTIISSVFLLITLCFFGFAIFKNVRYNQIFFLLSEMPEMKIIDLIKKSNEVMKGNFWKNFMLNLSFFGWNLLVIVGMIIILSPFYATGNMTFASLLLYILMIPFIFIHIYSLVSKAVYYRQLTTNK